MLYIGGNKVKANEVLLKIQAIGSTSHRQFFVSRKIKRQLKTIKTNENLLTHSYFVSYNVWQS